MASKTNPLNAVYWALRIATLLMLAGHLGVIIIGGIVSLVSAPGNLSMFIFPVCYILIAGGVYTGIMKAGFRHIPTATILAFILLGDIIGLILSPQAGSPYAAIVLSVIFVTITAVVESKRNARVAAVDIAAEATPPEPES